MAMVYLMLRFSRPSYTPLNRGISRDTDQMLQQQVFGILPGCQKSSKNDVLWSAAASRPQAYRHGIENLDLGVYSRAFLASWQGEDNLLFQNLVGVSASFPTEGAVIDHHQ